MCCQTKQMLHPCTDSLDIPFSQNVVWQGNCLPFVKTWKFLKEVCNIRILPGCWPHAGNRQQQELAALRLSLADCAMNFKRIGTTTDSFHDLFQNTRRWVSYSRNDIIWHKNCFNRLPQLRATAQLSHVQVTWLHQAPSWLLLLGKAISNSEGYSKTRLLCCGESELWKMFSLSKSRLLLPNKVSPPLGIFGRWVLLPLCRCHVITDKSPITGASMSGYERKTKDYVSFIALFLFDIFWLKLGSLQIQTEVHNHKGKVHFHKFLSKGKY